MDVLTDSSQVAAAGSAAEKGMLPLPVYLNAGRSDLLFNVELKVLAFKVLEMGYWK